MTEDEMVGWHHQLDGHEFEQFLGDGIGQGGLACCSSWGCKELDTTQQLNGKFQLFENFEVKFVVIYIIFISHQKQQFK